MRVVRSDGQEMTFEGNWRGGWAIAQDGLDDFLDLALTVTTSANVLTDGSSLIAKRVEECERTASVIYAGNGDPQAVRNQALSFFNPKFGFEVHVTHLGRTRWCEGQLTAVEVPLKKQGWPCQASFTLLCPDPWMKSEDGNENALTDDKPMFGFPYVCHARETMADGRKYPVGAPASVSIYDGKNTVFNSGDVETYYRIVCKASGSIVNPKFTKDDRFVQVVTTLNDGDELVVDFESAPPRVTINGANAIQMCSRDSNFTGMAMQVGANVFNYSCDNAANRQLMNVQILFHKKYLGV